MLHMKIETGNMNIYDIWIDGEKNCHLIAEMNSEYIIRCIGQIRKAANLWRFDNYDGLTQSEKTKICVPMTKAWLVVSGIAYLKSFRFELEKREEDTSYADATINYILDASKSV